MLYCIIFYHHIFKTKPLSLQSTECLNHLSRNICPNKAQNVSFMILGTFSPTNHKRPTYFSKNICPHKAQNAPFMFSGMFVATKHKMTHICFQEHLSSRSTKCSIYVSRNIFLESTKCLIYVSVNIWEPLLTEVVVS